MHSYISGTAVARKFSVLYKRCSVKFCKIRRKHLCWSLFFLINLIKKDITEIPAEVFFCEFYKNFTEHLRVTASEQLWRSAFYKKPVITGNYSLRLSKTLQDIFNFTISHLDGFNLVTAAQARFTCSKSTVETRKQICEICSQLTTKRTVFS